MRRILFVLFCSIWGLPSFGQIINAYAQITGIAGSTLTLGTVDQTAHQFIVGEMVVVMQMQDDVIGANTNNDALFGDLSSIQSAGLYEVRMIAAINGNSTAGFSSATPTSIDLVSLNNTYNTGANSRVQLITFRQMSALDYATTGNISALAWDGTIGGVVAMYVPGTLTLNHSISVNALGFRGGNRSNNNNGPVCVAANSTRYRENNNQLGFKGEGIYRSTNNLYNNGRAKILNGGGGGSHHNGGGAGGGNYTTGGIGGQGYNNCSANPGGGLGGVSLSAFIGADRVFMGGGGGGGQMNNTQGRNGGNGGGIILLRAGTIETNSCAGVSITANGVGPANNGTNDGGGGGGAAGSIVLWVDNWNVSGSCPLTITANGGNGSTSNTGAPHGGGGAGAQGVVIFNGPQPVTNVSTTTNNGTPGCDINNCSVTAGSASGTNNSGILPNLNTNNPLPVELVDFGARLVDPGIAEVKWITASEVNNDYFRLFRSSDGINWMEVFSCSGQGNSNSIHHYSFMDHFMQNGINYYRLTQTDFDGTTKSFGPVLVDNRSEEFSFEVFPNPVENLVHVRFKSNSTVSLKLITPEGKELLHHGSGSADNFMLDLSGYPTGVYFIELTETTGRKHISKLIKQ